MGCPGGKNQYDRRICETEYVSGKFGWSGNGTRSVNSRGKYRSIRHVKISEIQIGFFGRMDRAPVVVPHGSMSMEPRERAFSTRKLRYKVNIINANLHKSHL